MGKVLIAMSGGVDSSVAAYLLKHSGWDCVGATMTLYRNEDIGISHSRTCCSLEDVDHILKEVPRIVAYLRSISPVWKDLASGKKQFML